jgi:ankyrin repeat protein
MIPPIVSAAYQGSLELVQKLIDEGADVNATTTEKIDGNLFGVGSNALMIAAAYCLSDVLTALLKAGADVDQMSEYGVTVLWYVVRPQFYTCDSLSILQAILNHSQHPVNLNIRFGHGVTPLFAALDRVLYDRVEGVIRLLVKAGADVNLKCGDYTPLDNVLMQIHHARIHRRHGLNDITLQLRRIAEFLMNHGALSSRPEAREILKELFSPKEITAARGSAAFSRRSPALMAFARFQAARVAQEAAEAGNNNAAAAPAAIEPSGGAGAAPRRWKNTRRSTNYRKQMSRRRNY